MLISCALKGYSGFIIPVIPRHRAFLCFSIPLSISYNQTITHFHSKSFCWTWNPLIHHNLHPHHLSPGCTTVQPLSSCPSCFYLHTSGMLIFLKHEAAPAICYLKDKPLIVPLRLQVKIQETWLRIRNRSNFNSSHFPQPYFHLEFFFSVPENYNYFDYSFLFTWSVPLLTHIALVYLYPSLGDCSTHQPEKKKCSLIPHYSVPSESSA